jgi:hypothetical protein
MLPDAAAWPRVTLKRYTALMDYGTASMRQDLVREMGATMPRGGGGRRGMIAFDRDGCVRAKEALALDFWRRCSNGSAGLCFDWPSATDNRAHDVLRV